MWLATRYGWYSITCARADEGRGRVDPALLMVRARQRRHLDLLQERFPALAKFEIRMDPHADYRYRLIVPKAEWVPIVGELAAEVDYPNFKDEVDDFQDEAGTDYVGALHKIWAVMRDLQAHEPIALTPEAIAGIRDFCLPRYRQIHASKDYVERIGLSRAYRTWAVQFNLPDRASEFALAVCERWAAHPDKAENLEIPGDLAREVVLPGKPAPRVPQDGPEGLR